MLAGNRSGGKDGGGGNSKERGIVKDGMKLTIVGDDMADILGDMHALFGVS